MTSATTIANLRAHPAYGRLRDQIVERTGLAYYLCQEEQLAARIAGRMSALGLTQLGQYVARLLGGESNGTEWEALIAELTIGETFFFRHREQFDALRDHVLPEVIQRNQQYRRIRIWSAGCATGAEPYSIAILFKRELSHLVLGWDITILGTDINRDFLDRAQLGEFPEWAFRAGSDEVKRMCFSRTGNLWRINPQYKQGVSFQYHNLVHHPCPSLLDTCSLFDVILCRNVMIYFHSDTIRRIVDQFYNCLVVGGWLLVGHAESNVETFRSFRTVNAPGAVLYQKVQKPESYSHSLSFPAVSTAPDPLPVRRTSVLTGGKTEVQAKHLPNVSRLSRPIVQCSVDIVDKLAEIRTKADRAQWHEAALCCEELLTSNGLNPTVHFYHALVLEQIGRQAETEQALRRAIYLDRRFVLAHYHLGLLLQKRRDLPGAERHFRNTIQLLNLMDPEQAFMDADGLTVEALKQWAQTHLEVLRGT